MSTGEHGLQGVSILNSYPRLVLRCRSEARKRFAAIRSDVLVKLELLDNKHVQDIVHQVRYHYHNKLGLSCAKLSGARVSLV